jgi:hypothetical protein
MYERCEEVGIVLAAAGIAFASMSFPKMSMALAISGLALTVVAWRRRR